MYLKRLNKAQEVFQKEIEKIAEEVRQEYVIPACQKYNLEFLSGNGTFAFYGTWEGLEVSVSDPEEAKIYGWKLKKVFSILNTEVGDLFYLGNYMLDVKRG